MTARDLVRQAALESTILDLLRVSAAHTRERLAAQMEAGDRIQSDVGMAYVTAPKTAWKVVDRAAWTAWVSEHHPAAIVTTVAVSPAWEKDMLGKLPLDGGELPDGVDEHQGKPTLKVCANEEAKRIASEMLPGLLAIGGA